MNFNLSQEDIFIPSFNKNKELPETDQIRVLYRVPTMAIKNRCRRKPQAKAVSAKNGSIDHFEIVIEKDELATLNEMLISITNCSYTYRDGKVNKITNTQSLIDAPVAFEPLYKEVVKEFDRILDETIDEKN